MLEVLKPGLFTTVQDLGRWGYQEFGVGVAGALDSFALSSANLLVGNPEDAAGLEITLLGPALKFRHEALFAVTGADLDPKLDGRPIPNWTCCAAPPGGVLSFGRRKSGVRAYLAVSEGIDVPLVMGSRSTYLLGKFGGFEGRALKAGDSLRIIRTGPIPEDRVGMIFPQEFRPLYRKDPLLRAVPGPFEEFFSDEGIQAFFSEIYSITPQSDRMGYRLQGTAITRKKKEELITCGLADGTIQVPPNGQPILLMADRQTIGGYPIIATLINADLPLVAQCAPGDRLRFQPVSVDEGRQAYLQLWGRLKAFKTG